MANHVMAALNIPTIARPLLRWWVWGALVVGSAVRLFLVFHSEGTLDLPLWRAMRKAYTISA